MLEFIQSSPNTRSDTEAFIAKLQRALREFDRGDHAKAVEVLEQAYASAGPVSIEMTRTVSNDEMENGAILHLLQQLIFAVSTVAQQP